MEKVPAARLSSELVAMRPVCLEGLGRVSELLLRDGRCYDPRSIRGLVEALARFFAVDLVALRRRCSELLRGRNYLPLPFSPRLVLVPLPLGCGGERMGYINLLEYKGVAARDKFSQVMVGDGCVLDCYLSAGAVHNRILRAQLVLGEAEKDLFPLSPDALRQLDWLRTLLSKG
ncbi:MAG: hypothetical protein GX090_04685 [Firmicutes bacterium]|jgi:hypothetical protein|nr:hypothetical protein [Bacillota bacterium]HOB34243.1 hypothetical protein [Bacillota bacterium]HPZ89954.1 hypothetical protein [Bacillota bacterium]HQE01360.1 hypothetical protein [Bacillota bacterium]